MKRRIVLVGTVVLLVCLLAIGVTSADKSSEMSVVPTTTIPELSVDAGEGAKARKEEGKVGKREAKLDKAKGAKIEIKKLELDRKIAENGGFADEIPDRFVDLLIEKPAPTAGQTIYVSNDDSMSLASAQHVLFALQNQERLALKDIRPHELLNYFTFKTAAPEAGELFDVFASAEKDGDHLHVALAVRGATPPRLPLDLTLLVDISGSMDTDGKLERTKRALLLLIQQLRSGDRVDLVWFNNTVTVPVSDWVVGADRPDVLKLAITEMVADGSTDLNSGLQEAYRLARSHERTQGRNRRILLITDANLNTGQVDPAIVTNIARAFEESGIRLTGVGVGSDFRDDVLDQLTEKGKGAYVFLGSDAVVDRLFGPAGFASLTQTIAHDVRFALKLPSSLSMEQFFGEEASTNPEEVQPVHFSAGSSQVLLQDLVLHGGVLDKDDTIELEIRYRDAQTDQEQIRRFRSSVGRMVTTDPFNVRKGRALMAWTDFLIADAHRVNACGSALGEFLERAAPVAEDREIAFIRQLSQNRCDDGAIQVSARR